MNDKVRLLICTHCGTVQEMPDYDGNWKDDAWLVRLVREDHQGPNHPPSSQVTHIGRVEASDWNDPSKRQGILGKLPEEVGMPGSGQGLGQTYYDVKSNFTEDAFRCWKQHNRTVDCGDYRKDSKKLLPDTRADRKELGLDPKSRPNTFLCDFCPVHARVVQLRRKKEGMYDKKKWE